MSDWQAQMEAALSEFTKVAALAGHMIPLDEIEAEFRAAPHRSSSLPLGKMAVYAFWGDGEWLKIGRVGANSNARYNSQHYSPGRANSSLANSLCRDERICTNPGFSEETCSDWIRANTHRCNLLISAKHPKSLLSLLEAFLHHRLKPRYEG